MSDRVAGEPRPYDYVPLLEPTWGFVENGRFYMESKWPLIIAGLRPPCRVVVYSEPRDIIECPPELEPYLGYQGG